MKPNMVAKKTEEKNKVANKKESVECKYLAAQIRHQELKSLARADRKVGHAAELKKAQQQMVNLEKKLGAPVKAPKSAAERKREVISYCYKRCILQKQTVGWQSWACKGRNFHIFGPKTNTKDVSYNNNKNTTSKHQLSTQSLNKESQDRKESRQLANRVRTAKVGISMSFGNLWAQYRWWLFNYAKCWPQARENESCQETESRQEADRIRHKKVKI